MSRDEYIAMLNAPHNSATSRKVIANLVLAYDLLAPDLMKIHAMKMRVKSLEARKATSHEIIRDLLATMLEAVSVNNWPDENGN